MPKKYTVKKTRDVAGSPKDSTDVVTAQDSEQAIRKSMRRDAYVGSYDSVSATQDDGHAGAPRTEPQVNSKVSAKTQGMAGFESLNYPYHIGVHLGFRPLFEKLPKKVQEGFTLSTRYGKLHIVVPDAASMNNLMEALGKRARGKTAFKEQARVIHDGITESVKL